MAEARKASEKESEETAPERLRWYVGVPLGTNPLILVDLAVVLIVSWLVCWVALLGLQLALGGYVDATHLAGAATVANWMAGIFGGVFALICLVIMRNRYAALYRFDPQGAYCDNMRAAAKAADGRFFHFTGYPVEPVTSSLRSAERRASWSDVRKIQTVDEMRVILLKGKRGPLMRVYCPDSETFRRALDYARSHSSSE